ncbi:MAG TPA: M48 family metallopeptidase [Flavisolibacter sp.]|nr:M48 family metallopeptidase [Flavisolibacter sp.]
MAGKSLLFIVAIITFYSCSKNSITGRSQLKLLPESELQTMATQQYQQFLTQNKVVGSTASGNYGRDAEMVRRVGQKLSKAVEDYFKSKGIQNQLKGYQWEYNLVENKEANAWCMPGGKIVVYTGLLPYTKNETALAIVLGHEITHAVLQHGNERMSQGLLQQFGAVALSAALSQKPEATQNLFLQSYGVGSTVLGTLPFSRKDESEADHYGLIWAALAGYDPQEAVPFWQRMAQSGGQKPPEFLSDHPSDQNRIEQIKQWMPEALKYYHQNGK